MTPLRIPTATRPLATLAAAAALVALVAGILTAQASTTHPEVRDDNEAFLEVDATDAVIQQTQQIVERAFTFDPQSVAAARRAARRSLVEEAMTQYAKLYEPLFEQSRTTGLRLTTTVRSVGVESLDDGHAELLVLADQTAASPDGQSTTGAAQLAVTAEEQHGQWKIARIKLL